jgi:peptidoglycan/xylan/chitin deacetylase (PgdA/CDA1 family)
VNARAGLLAACGVWVGLAGCGTSDDRTEAPTDTPGPAIRIPEPAPDIELTQKEQHDWTELPPDRSAIPVVLYHGIGPESDFANPEDAAYGVGAEEFARQMTLLAHAGYRTVDLQTFIDFVQGKPVELPGRPLLLTFDDGRADTWTGADGILAELGFTAVLFVDVGTVDDGDVPEYLTWPELEAVQDTGRWNLQLHAGHGHQFIETGPDPDDRGPYYAVQQEGESFEEWQERERSDIAWGQETLAGHIPAYEPLAFAPPFGNYGQADPRLADDLLGWLTERYDAIFTQDENARAEPGSEQPLGRIPVDRATAPGDLYDMLLSGEQG